MVKSKVELISRYVEGVSKKYDHLFILFTFSNGAKQVIRGAPFNEKHSYEFIFVHSQNYAHSIDNCKHKGYECSTPYNLYQGSDTEVKKLHNFFLIKAEEINRSYYDYKLPDFRCEVPKLGGKAISKAAKDIFKSTCHLQNSNTAVAQLLKSANIQFELPTRNDVPVNAIGYDQELKHSPVDKITELLQMAIKLNTIQGSDIEMDQEADQKLKVASDAYTKALVEKFDPIRQSQETQLYPDNMMCCLGDTANTCKQCDLMVHDDL